jgi:hypothetical protein
MCINGRNFQFSTFFHNLFSTIYIVNINYYKFFEKLRKFSQKGSAKSTHSCSQGKPKKSKIKLNESKAKYNRNSLKFTKIDRIP